MTRLRFQAKWFLARAFEAADSDKAREGSLLADVRLALFSDRVYNQSGFWAFPSTQTDGFWLA